MKTILAVGVGLGLATLSAQGQWSYATAVVSASDSSGTYSATNLLSGRYAVSGITVTMPSSTYAPASGVEFKFYDCNYSNTANTICVITNYQSAWTSNYWIAYTNTITYTNSTYGTYAVPGTVGLNGTTYYWTNSPGGVSGIITNYDIGMYLTNASVSAALVAPPVALDIMQLPVTQVVYTTPMITTRGLWVKALSAVTNAIITVKYHAF